MSNHPSFASFQSFPSQFTTTTPPSFASLKIIRIMVQNSPKDGVWLRFAYTIVRCAEQRRRDSRCRIW